MKASVETCRKNKIRMAIPLMVTRGVGFSA